MNLLVTGGTGSLGRFLVEHVLRENLAERVIVYSRDEFKQGQMRDKPWGDDARLRYMLGDVRDEDRLRRAMVGVDTVIHTAALARVDGYNCDEIVRTNVLGTERVIEAAADRGVGRVLVVCSDKGCHPSNFYGGSKFLAEQLAVQANAYTFPRGTRVGGVRMGNLMWSRDSVAERFSLQLMVNELPFRVTDRRMSRFGFPMPEAVAFILSSLEMLRGGEVFVPRLKAFRIVDLAEALYLNYRRAHEKTPIKVTGGRPGGEKTAEMILTPEESVNTVWIGDRWVVEPHYRSWTRERWEGEPVPEGFEYTSDKATDSFTQAELRDTLQWIPR